MHTLYTKTIKSKKKGEKKKCTLAHTHPYYKEKQAAHCCSCCSTCLLASMHTVKAGVPLSMYRVPQAWVSEHWSEGGSSHSTEK